MEGGDSWVYTAVPRASLFLSFLLSTWGSWDAQTFYRLDVSLMCHYVTSPLPLHEL